MMSAFLSACLQTRRLIIGPITMLPGCHSYHFSKTSLCSLSFATDLSGFEEIWIFIRF